MILTGSAINSAVRGGAITVDPFDPRNLNPNSYNFHLGESLLVRVDEKWSRTRIDDTGFILKPGQVYLAATLERIGSDRFVTLLLGRSSLGRLGLFLNITADLGHIGSCSHWTLELTVVQTLRIYPRMPIGQISFWRTAETDAKHYRGRYHRDDAPKPNRDARIVSPSR